MATNAPFLFPNLVTFTISSTGGNTVQGGASVVVTGASATTLIYHPGTSVGATSLVAGVTYQIATMGTSTSANWVTAGAPANATVGTVFTAVAAGVGTGTCTVSPLSCIINAPGIPAGVYISAQVTGTAGGNGTYTLSSLTAAIIPVIAAGTTATQGNNYNLPANATTAANLPSLPVWVDGPIVSVNVHGNAADTGTLTTTLYVQASVDGINWFNASTALSLTATAPAQWLSTTSANQMAYNAFRILAGTTGTTGTINIGAAIRSIWQNKN